MTDSIRLSAIYAWYSHRLGKLWRSTIFPFTFNEIIGFVGESGAGKSMTGAAIIGLPILPLYRTWRDLAGQPTVDQSVRGDASLIRGKRISMIFQDPPTSLNPADDR